MTIYLSADFTGSNGTSAVGADWLARYVTAGATATLQNNRLRLDNGTATEYAGSYRLSWNHADVTDVEVSGIVNLDSGNGETHAYVWLREQAAGGTDGSDGYMLEFTSSGTLVEAKIVQWGGTGTGNVGTPKSMTLTPGVDYGFRFQIVGDLHQWRVWPAANAEPEIWDSSATDSATPFTSGMVTLVSGPTGAANGIVDFDSIVITDGVGGPITPPTHGVVTYVSTGTKAVGTVASATSIAPGYPTGISAGDRLVLIVGQKPTTANGGTVTTPSGWTAHGMLKGAGGFGSTLSTTQGNTNIYAFTKDTVDGTESGTLAVTLGVNSVAWAAIVCLTCSDAQWEGTDPGVTGSDVTAGAAVSVTLSSDPGFIEGDLALGAFTAGTSAVTSYSLESVTAPGATFGPVTEIVDARSTIGNRIGGFVAYAVCTGGPSTGPATMTATAAGTTTYARGPGIALRFRQTYSAPVVDVPATGAGTVTAQATATARIDVAVINLNGAAPGAVHAAGTTTARVARFGAALGTSATTGTAQAVTGTAASAAAPTVATGAATGTVARSGAAGGAAVAAGVALAQVGAAGSGTGVAVAGAVAVAAIGGGAPTATASGQVAAGSVAVGQVAALASASGAAVAGAVALAQVARYAQGSATVTAGAVAAGVAAAGGPSAGAVVTAGASASAVVNRTGAAIGALHGAATAVGVVARFAVALAHANAGSSATAALIGPVLYGTALADSEPTTRGVPGAAHGPGARPGSRPAHNGTAGISPGPQSLPGSRAAASGSADVDLAAYATSEG